MIQFSSSRAHIPLVTWVALGAGLMYLFDPASGNRRRSLVRGKLTHLARVGRAGAHRTKRDLTNRVHGLGPRVRARIRPEEQLPDEVLAERVRSKMGVIVSHPHAVEVRVDGGEVTLQGQILQREAKVLVRRVKRMAGVRQVLECVDTST